jgi:VIT1/CCC1 family predicted Fe2+/Mn2+ transporter
MKHSIKIGFSFGTTSGIITTLGLMVGLHSSTRSSLAVMGGILTIAIADAFSDALGIHVSEESENVHTHKEIWAATASTFLSKSIFALTFLVPVMLFDLEKAILVSIAWGMSMLCLFSYRLARDQGSAPLRVIGEHVFIALIVVVITHYLGDWIAKSFNYSA